MPARCAGDAQTLANPGVAKKLEDARKVALQLFKAAEKKGTTSHIWGPRIQS